MKAAFHVSIPIFILHMLTMAIDFTLTLHTSQVSLYRVVHTFDIRTKNALLIFMHTYTKQW